MVRKVEKKSGKKKSKRRARQPKTMPRVCVRTLSNVKFTLDVDFGSTVVCYRNRTTLFSFFAHEVPADVGEIAPV